MPLMFPSPWQRLAKPSRLVAGLMSGTSLDGIDAAVVRLTGSGRALVIEPRAFVSVPYPPALRQALLANSAPGTSSVRELALLNVRLAHAYAGAVHRAAAAAGVSVADLDLIGSHGQTVHHVPEATDCAGEAVTATLQIGDPSVLANLLGVPVVGDFRPADMALGGQGAPLVPYFDYVAFAHERETRGVLNIGGIANLTVLPRNPRLEDVRAFDTGPGNMVLDALARRLLDRPYDEGGALAARGTPHEALLAELLDHPYFARTPPKSTGRELFGADFVERLCERAEALGLEAADLMATAVALTARSIEQAYLRFVAPRHRLDVLLVGGGGVHNTCLMQHLETRFAPVPVRSVAAAGIDPDAKEALCFAVLAHETVNGVPTNLPAVTGAARPTLLGKICLPGAR
ncbi:anhydro-N-acetylmuramic acid kinase [Rhodocaloribacter litoris]|uniref:anhydro-N-acetylmuramic acid kinase n=1 Tax=Rhodocaloribacter litoris TaxID=2558931 RepID=UPI001E4A3C2F|nr:anhydro-N-acetylmuramic acid kinase [Rhodocaloribacter litoris]